MQGYGAEQSSIQFAHRPPGRPMPAVPSGGMYHVGGGSSEANASYIYEGYSSSAAWNAVKNFMNTWAGPGFVTISRDVLQGFGGKITNVRERICLSVRLTADGPWTLPPYYQGKAPSCAQTSMARRAPVARLVRQRRSMRGYGAVPILPATPEDAAQQLCAYMGGQWRADANECQVGDQTYALPDFLPSALPSGTCPPDQVMTPAGCKPIPGGVESECPPGMIMSQTQGCVPGTVKPPLPNGQVSACHASGGAWDPETGSCKMPPVAPPEPETPSWVLPAAIGGIAAIAIIGLVVTR